MLFVITMFLICVWLLSRSFNSRTALVWTLILTVTVSFFMTITSLSFIGGVAITAVAGLAITLMDEAGMLA